MRLVFVDVGTHNGQTLKEVTRARWGFDLILGLEPMPDQFRRAFARFGGMRQVRLFNVGLADRSGAVQLYGDNSDMGASIFENKKRVAENQRITICEMVEASAFFQEFIRPSDVVLMKLNCEGAEIPILHNLIDSGEIFKIDQVMIDFDIRKVAGQEGQDVNLLERFASIGFDRFALADDVMHGRSHEMRIAAWLKTTGVFPQTPFFLAGDLANWMNYAMRRATIGLHKARSSSA